MGTSLDLSLRLPESLSELEVLNLGAGYCASPVSEQLIRLRFKKLTNVEVWPAAFSKLVQINFQTPTVANYQEDALAFVMKHSGPATYDVVLLIDALEHLAAREAEILLALCRRIGKRVVIFLPLGNCPQEPYDNNPFQKHLSTWHVTDFPGASIDVIKGQHVQFTPPVDAAWVIYDS